MWQKIKAACFNSATMAVQYIALAFGVVVTNLDNIAAIVGDPGFVTWVESWLGGNPKVVGAVVAMFSTITMIARLRTLVRRA